MASSTTNYNLSKPDYTDAADIAVINSNMDKIDTALSGLNTRLTTAEGNITSLQDSVSSKDITPTDYTLEDGVTVKELHVFRCAKVVFVMFYFMLASNKANNTALVVFNSRLPQPASYSTQSVVGDAEHGVSGTLEILAARPHVIYCNGTVQAGSYLVSQFCYVSI